jgi:hypothetical protein
MTATPGDRDYHEHIYLFASERRGEVPSLTREGGSPPWCSSATRGIGGRTPLTFFPNRSTVEGHSRDQHDLANELGGDLPGCNGLESGGCCDLSGGLPLKPVLDRSTGGSPRAWGGPGCHQLRRAKAYDPPSRSPAHWQFGQSAEQHVGSQRQLLHAHGEAHCREPRS